MLVVSVGGVNTAIYGKNIFGPLNTSNWPTTQTKIDFVQIFALQIWFYQALYAICFRRVVCLYIKRGKSSN